MKDVTPQERQSIKNHPSHFLAMYGDRAMKALEWVKQNIQEWPEKCTHITVDMDGGIWINEGNPTESQFKDDVWKSRWIDYYTGVCGSIDDPESIILPEHFKEAAEKDIQQRSVSSEDCMEEFDVISLAKSLANAGDTLQQALQDQREVDGRVQKAQKGYQEALEDLRSAL